MTNQRDETMTENDTNKASQVVSSHSNISNEIHTTNVMIFYSFYVFFDFFKRAGGRNYILDLAKNLQECHVFFNKYKNHTYTHIVSNLDCVSNLECKS